MPHKEMRIGGGCETEKTSDRLEKAGQGSYSRPREEKTPWMLRSQI